MKYALLDSGLIDRIATSPSDEQARWLVLEPHPDFPGHWEVNGLSSSFLHDLKDIIGQYRVVAPAGLNTFLDAADEYDYKVAFGEEPTDILDAYQGLNDPPAVEVNSDMAGTVNGMLPFQVQGFNYLKDKNGYVVWSTGTGKTVLASALTKYHQDLGNFEVAFFVVKAHNKINTQRALKRLVDIDALVVEGPPKWRERLYHRIHSSTQIVAVINYEKFRDDFVEFVEREDKETPDVILHDLFEDIFQSKVLCIWDEMPTKLKNRGTKLYHAVCTCLYQTKAPPRIGKQRPAELRQYALSATPIENDPEDSFNCVRLIEPDLLGTVTEFKSEYVASYNFWNPFKPEAWHHLDKLSLKLASICHQVDKSDPDIASQFPRVIPESFYIDWADEDRKVYDRLVKLAKEIAAKDDEENLNVLGMISVLQMICDAPSIVNNSAALYEAYEQAVSEFELAGGEAPLKRGSETARTLIEAIGHPLNDNTHTKLDTLRLLLTEEHPDEKIVLFSALNKTLMPVLEAWLAEWGVKYVRYHGTAKQKQTAEDTFREDPSVRVFLSSDAGSDSINLEMASVVIDYDLPWKWSTRVQRHNRIHRITSKHAIVRYYTLMMANSVEDRKLEIIEQKQAYHQAVFGGAVADQSLSARMSREDLLYILLGEDGER